MNPWNWHFFYQCFFFFYFLLPFFAQLSLYFRFSYFAFSFLLQPDRLSFWMWQPKSGEGWTLCSFKFKKSIDAFWGTKIAEGSVGHSCDKPRCCCCCCCYRINQSFCPCLVKLRTKEEKSSLRRRSCWNWRHSFFEILLFYEDIGDCFFPSSFGNNVVGSKKFRFNILDLWNWGNISRAKEKVTHLKCCHINHRVKSICLLHRNLSSC